jgi:hypothetical protein
MMRRSMLKIILWAEEQQEIQGFEPTPQSIVLEPELGAGRGLLEMPELRSQQMRVR